MARQPSGKKSASPDDALDDVKVTDEVDVASAPSSEPVSGSDEVTDVAASEGSDVDASSDVADSAEEDVDDPAEEDAEEVDDVDAADTSDEDEDEDDAEEGDAEAAASADEESDERSLEAAELWSDVRIEPVEIALPKGVGFTLRAYRMSNELATVEVVEEEDDAFAVLNRSPVVDEDEEFEFDEAVFDERPGAHEEAPPARRGRKGKDDEDEPVEAGLDKDDSESSDSGEEDSGDDESDEELAGEDDEAEADAEADDEEDEDEEDDEPEPEEVPLFLRADGKLLLFRSPEGLVEFVKTAEEHDFTQLDTWEDLRSRITVEAIVPSDDDSYELDLVVENLRGGHDAWDTALLIGAGEAARDLAYALRLEAVRTALAPGSPLDDLDEGLRASAGGGMGGFFARRKLKKIGAQQAALGWRTIIGKISAVVDWRD